MIRKIFISSIFIFIQFNFSFAQHLPQLWGLTSAGSETDFGTIFHYTPSTNTHILDYSFQNIAQGANPQMTDLTDGGSGKLYGMTYSGGAGFSGVIFEYDTITHSYTKKVDLTSTTGNFPKGSLSLYAGKYYGMTSLGGINNKGTLFEWDPITNIITNKIDLNITDGCSPAGSLTLFGGKFYGLTYQGGLSNKGVIFEWDPVTNIYVKKIDLTAANGANPYGTLELNGSLFYGMTYTGGAGNAGVIFTWDPATNVYTKKIDFIATSGKNPYGKLLYSGGNFYGMTFIGGANNRGVIFEWNPTTNMYTKKIDFSLANGSYPQGSLSLKGSKLYGLTKAGGANDKGVIFEWDPATNIYTNKIDLNSSIGYNPLGSLLNVGGLFYGLTNLGGLYGNGVIFQWNEAANSYSKKLEFNSTNGNLPEGSLVFNKGKYYGMTNSGGLFDNGVIFEWDPSTNTYTKKYDFDIVNGGKPTGSLLLYGGKYYGTTSSGGINNAGVIFEWNDSTNVFTKKIDLISTNGVTPYGSLSVYGTKLYGMTNQGGANNLGVIFEWDPTTNIFNKKIDFSLALGGNPYGSLTFNGTSFFGLTFNGGANALGVIFEWNPSTNIYTKEYDLVDTLGSHPNGSLIFNGGLFFGLTQMGGANGGGALFTWDPTTNSYMDKFDFDFTQGIYPEGTLTLSSSGKYYGLTKEGGANNLGTLFEWDEATNTLVQKFDFSGTAGAPLGANPFYTQLLERVSNVVPVFSSNASVMNMCMNSTSANPFSVTDADGDLISFTMNSSNTSLLPNSNISISNISGSNYQATYTPVVGQLGSTTITITAIDGFGGSTAYIFNLNVTAIPIVTANASINIVCQGQAVTLFGGGAASYSWSGGITDGVSFIPSATTTYTVTGTIVGCGTNTATQLITVNLIPVVSANASTTHVCTGQSLILTGGGAASYSWTSGVANGVAFIPLSTSTYIVTGTTAGCSDTAVITVDINSPPILNISASNTIVCQGEPVTLTGIGTGSSYVWSGGVTNGVAFIPVGSITYSVTASDAFCTSTGTILITSNPVNISVNQVANTLTANATGASYQWIDCNNFNLPIASETFQSYTPVLPGSYAVIINQGGCIDTSSCISVIPTSICIRPNTSVQVFPNPTSGQISISLGNKSNAKVELYTVLGKFIFSKEVSELNNSISILDQSDGIYFLKIYLGDNVMMSKIVLVK
ncbi:MAG: T9SS type A sorting domain-containing protein [Bacteroidetes bacterium]|nr:T9SS type A sorting domain-containing protein [Bacteroidota bacterium]